MNIFIGGAWPYANGSLHIGHIAALLPGDILARYFRMKKYNVCYVSGSDCHGTPIQIRANREGVPPKQIAEKYHAEFRKCFEKLGFSYDIYNHTDDPYHIKFVQEFFIHLTDSGYITAKTVEQAYCDRCRQFLPDRFVTGKCPICGSNARGDQCDACGALLEPALLQDTACGICGSVPVFKSSRHLFLTLSWLEEFINSFIENSEGWRANAVGLSKRYVKEGLQDRAVTRDLDWGIPVPVKGLEDKKIYVWVEAVLGYLSACKKWAEESGKDWTAFWQAGRSESEDSRSLHYYVHGKDNIPFHTVILPALLHAHGGFHLPDRILSSEYVTLEGRKISTSQNWAVWIPYLLEHYHPDSIRYFFIANGPEKRDADFSWREFINSHNGELLGAFGNFVNRSLVFIQKSFSGQVPSGQCNPAIRQALQELYPVVGEAIEQGNFKDGLDAVFAFIRSANKYFDEQQPWITVREDIHKCSDALFTCVQIIANLSVLLKPFLPFSAEKIQQMLGIEKHVWSFSEVPAGLSLNEVRILFERIDKKKIRKEEEKLS